MDLGSHNTSDAVAQVHFLRQHHFHQPLNFGHRFGRWKCLGPASNPKIRFSDRKEQAFPAVFASLGFEQILGCKGWVSAFLQPVQFDLVSHFLSHIHGDCGKHIAMGTVPSTN